MFLEILSQQQQSNHNWNILSACAFCGLNSSTYTETAESLEMLKYYLSKKNLNIQCQSRPLTWQLGSRSTSIVIAATHVTLHKMLTAYVIQPLDWHLMPKLWIFNYYSYVDSSNTILLILSNVYRNPKNRIVGNIIGNVENLYNKNIQT